jgi:hypothetical protein
MQKVDTSHDLLRALSMQTITSENLTQYVAVLIERLARLTVQYSSELHSYIQKGATHIKDEIISTCDWAYTATPFLNADTVNQAKALFEQAFAVEPYFKNPPALSVVIDTNPDNIIFLDGSVSFLDVMPPKDSWRVHDRYFPLCRTSVDVSLFNPSLAEAIHSAYGEREVRPSPIVRAVYELAAALIQVPYRKMVGQDVLAKKYGLFVQTCITRLESELKKEKEAEL